MRSGILMLVQCNNRAIASLALAKFLLLNLPTKLRLHIFKAAGKGRFNVSRKAMKLRSVATRFWMICAHDNLSHSLEKILLNELCGVAAQTYQRGWNAGTAGNFSILRQDRSLVWMSPSGVPKGEMQAEQFIAVSNEAIPQVCSYRKPSDETPCILPFTAAGQQLAVWYMCIPPQWSGSHFCLAKS